MNGGGAVPGGGGASECITGGGGWAGGGGIGGGVEAKKLDANCMLRDIMCGVRGGGPWGRNPWSELDTTTSCLGSMLGGGTDVRMEARTGIGDACGGACGGGMEEEEAGDVIGGGAVDMRASNELELTDSGIDGGGRCRFDIGDVLGGLDFVKHN